MARKPTKTELREQARQAYEARQREKQYAIIKIENERGWGFVQSVTPQIIAYLVPDFHYAEGESIHTVNYSCVAYAFDLESVAHWAERVASGGDKATIIPVTERWDDIRYSYNQISSAQRYV